MLTISPLLLEKYIAAANAIVSKAVPTSSRESSRKPCRAVPFAVRATGKQPARTARGRFPSPTTIARSVARSFEAEHTGRYRLIVDLAATERFVDGVFDYNKCRLVFKVDGQELLRQEYSRQDGRPYRYELDRDWKAGPHTLTFELEPLTPGEKQVRSLALRLNSVTVQGPFDESLLDPSARTTPRFFPREVPGDPQTRRRYAREILGRFATKAFRRPVDEATLDRLVAVVEAVSETRGKPSRPALPGP